MIYTDKKGKPIGAVIKPGFMMVVPRLKKQIDRAIPKSEDMAKPLGNIYGVDVYTVKERELRKAIKEARNVE